MYINNNYLKTSSIAGFVAILSALAGYWCIIFLEIIQSDLHYEPYYIIIYSIINWFSFSYKYLKRINKKGKLIILCTLFASFIILYIVSHIFTRLLTGYAFIYAIYNTFIEKPFDFILPVIQIIVYVVIVFILFMKEEKRKLYLVITIISAFILAIIASFYFHFSFDLKLLKIIVGLYIFVSFIVINYFLRVFKENH